MTTSANNVVVQISEKQPWDVEADLMVVGFFDGEALQDVVRDLDVRLNGTISEAVSRGECESTWLSGWETASLGLIKARRVLLLGLGKRKEFGVRELRLAAGQSAQKAVAAHARSVSFWVPNLGLEPATVAEAITDGLMVGEWRFAGYAQQKSEQTSLKEAWILGLPVQGAAGVEQGTIAARAENLVRELGMRPSNKLYPERLAQEAVQAAHEHGFTAEVLNEAQLHELGMEALLGVGSGSIYPPRLVVLRYQGGGTRSLALVGKGITFDSGGISLKPGAGMEEMKFDMLGAAAVLGAMCVIADRDLPINVVGLMALAQNMPSGSAYKPGDVVKAFNGKTIEVTNTDAEGRVVLADAVSYAAHLGVDWIVETSTLTGAAITVFGHEATALVSTDDALADLVVQAAEAVGERVWRLPIYPEYRQLYRSPVADLKNSPGREAGTITGGMIIAEFAGDRPYAHLDIAGTAWTPVTPLNATKNGPTGVMVRTLSRLAELLAR
ncbi:MAG: leucyl aminopeptidase [Sulfobacillus acidophilus]|uniref:Probable cytosol aminopeptidase n=1 Tax=Sulfobacillus acidophilus TaxID=53633 RepID=A0A2T2WNK5_9FIRM|nr:MAG: leucyl aminopeptidase [Sulfobacillus acidophilus]